MVDPQHRPSRRSVARGAAWLAPAVVVGAPAPLLAASPSPVLQSSSEWHWYSNSAPYCGANRDGVTVETVAAGFVRVSSTTAATTISGVYLYFWFAKPAMTLTAGPGAGGCWTTPFADGTSVVSGGVTYYRYRSDYGCPVTAVTGTTTLGTYSWRTPCFDEVNFAPMQTARRQVFATVNGGAQSTDTGFFLIQTLRVPGRSVREHTSCLR